MSIIHMEGFESGDCLDELTDFRVPKRTDAPSHMTMVFMHDGVEIGRETLGFGVHDIDAKLGEYMRRAGVSE